MAKKRTTPPVNPLKQDLIASVVADIAPSSERSDPAPRSPQQRAAAKREYSKSSVRPPQPKARRRSPQQEKKGTRWTEQSAVQLKVRVGPQDADLIRTMVQKLGEKTGTNPSDANVARALWSLFMQLEEELVSVRQTNLHKPGYGDKERTALYEDDLAKVILKCFRRLPAIGPEHSGPNIRDQTR